MTAAVWRVSGETFDVDGFLRNHPTLDENVNAVWHKGEAWRGGRVHAESGFNATLFESASTAEVSDDMEKALQQWRGVAEALLAQGAESTIDVALMVGGEKSFASSVFVDAKVLQLLATLKIGLEISAYPVSDEDEDD